MQIVASTFIVLALIGVMLARGPYRGLVVLIGLTPMGMMAAFNLPAVGGTSVLAVDLAVVAMFGLLVLRRRGLTNMVEAFTPGGAGMMLLMFMAYALIATLFFPRIFANQTEVFGIGRVANEIGIVIQPLRPGNGNLSQLMRMILSIGAFTVAFALIRRRPDPRLVLQSMMVATGVHVAMGIIDVLSNGAGMAWLLEPVRTANYSLTLGQKMAGLNRMIGGFPEASTFGYFSLGVFGFWLSYWFSDRSRSRWPGIWLALATFALLRSTSSSAYVGAAGLCIVFTVVHMLRRGDGRLQHRTAMIVVICMAAVPVIAFGAFMLYELVPAFTDFIDRSLLNKLSSDSGVERMSWNAQALRNFADTWTLGAGLGSVRASQWLVACLATTGLVGTAFILVFLYRLFTATMPPGTDRATVGIVSALKWGCAGFLMRALVTYSTPNLDIAFFVMAGLSTGLVVAAMHTRSVTGRANASWQAPVRIPALFPYFKSTRPPARMTPEWPSRPLVLKQTWRITGKLPNL
jgi:hypothetical protein